MKEIDNNELRQIQVNILSAVADFCDRESLNYFLGYGSLIGAIRHHGYIPWDDDIDIIMPRPDYDVFIKKFNNDSDVIKVADITIDSKYELPYAKVYDSRTVMVETMYKPKTQYGVYIDVFPLDGYKEQRPLKRLRRLSNYLNAKKAIFDNRRSWGKTVIIYFGKLLLLPISTKRIISKMVALATKYEYDSCDMVDSMLTPYRFREICPKKWFDSYLLADFEGKRFRIPKCYDEYLRKIYGDYNILPPIEQQITHHCFKAWWIE